MTPAVLAAPARLDATARLDAAALRAAIAAVPDPEVPVITIEDLGILRDVVADEATGTVQVVDHADLQRLPGHGRDRPPGRARRAAAAAGPPTVATQLTPAWTTDWMIGRRARQAARRRHRPARSPRRRGGARAGARRPDRAAASTCPQCGSADTDEIARFGSTACKALRRCNDCREPFDEFKAI